MAGVRLTSPDKVLYSEVGLTKLELARYYEQIAERILPHVRDRALTLVRCPQGEHKHCFYQKHAQEGFPNQVRRASLGDDEEPYLFVTSLQGVIALVQMGTLELHTWGSRVDRPERPDRIILDLDPDPAVPWPHIVEGARAVRERLKELGLVSFVKTTGGKGLHVVAPIVRRNSWEEVREVARAIAEDVERRIPGRYVTRSGMAEREGKIFLDYLRNATEASAVCPYSVRAKPGAPVSVPLAWDELTPRMRSDQFAPDDVIRRVRSLGADPWAEYGATRQSITKRVRMELGLE